MVKSTKLTVKNKGGDLKKIKTYIRNAPARLTSGTKKAANIVVSGTKKAANTVVNGTKKAARTLRQTFRQITGLGKKRKQTANRKKSPAKKRKAKNGKNGSKK